LAPRACPFSAAAAEDERYRKIPHIQGSTSRAKVKTMLAAVLRHKPSLRRSARLLWAKQVAVVVTLHQSTRSHSAAPTSGEQLVVALGSEKPSDN
jgi:hypothetical protein